MVAVSGSGAPRSSPRPSRYSGFVTAPSSSRPLRIRLSVTSVSPCGRAKVRPAELGAERGGELMRVRLDRLDQFAKLAAFLLHLMYELLDVLLVAGDARVEHRVPGDPRALTRVRLDLSLQPVDP